MIEKLFSELPSRDIFSLLNSLGAWIERGAESIRIPPAILYAVGIVLAIGIGLSCYKLMKIWLGLLGAVAGYYLTGNGLMLFNAGSARDVPMLLVYVLAIVMAVGLFFLAFKNPTYVFFAVMAVAGFGMTYFYTQNELFSLIGALLLALICVFLVRVAFVIVSSLVGGTVAVSLLGALLPSMEILQLKAGNWVAMGIVVGLSAVFAAFQLLTVGLGKPREGKKPKPAKEKTAEASLFPFR